MVAPTGPEPVNDTTGSRGSATSAGAASLGIGTTEKAPVVGHIVPSWNDGELTLMPGGMALAVPTRLGPLLETPLLSLRGKLRMLLEPFVPPSVKDGRKRNFALIAGEPDTDVGATH